MSRMPSPPWSKLLSSAFGRIALFLVGFAVMYLFVWLTLPVWKGVYAFLQLTLPVWSTFLLAFFFAYLLDPVVVWLEGRGLNRTLGLVLIGTSLVLMLGGLWLLAVGVAAELSILVSALPGMVEGLEEFPFLLARRIDPTYDEVFQQVFISTQAWVERFSTEVLPSVQQIDGLAIAQRLPDLLGGGLQLTMMLVLTIYFLHRFQTYTTSFMHAIPERHRESVAAVAHELGYSVGGYFRGQLVIAATVGVLSWLGFVIIGMPLAAALGTMAGVLNIIPFFGPLLVSIPTVLLALTLGWPQVVGALVVLVVVNQIDAHVLTPIVFSQTVEIDPATIILAIFLGTVLFGIVGAILAVPAAVMLRFFYRKRYLESSWYQGTAPQVSDSDADAG